MGREFTYEDWAKLGESRRKDASSPFFSRSYAGYSGSQLETILATVAQDKTSIFDPMAGQAYALSTLTWLGHDVWLNDYNAALMLLAWLRSRAVQAEFEELRAEFVRWLSELHLGKEEGEAAGGPMEFNESWVSGRTATCLHALKKHLSPTPVRQMLEDEPAHRRDLFRLAAVVLAARRVTTYTKSDNRTWLKKGGVDRRPNLKNEIITELENLSSWRAGLLQRLGDDLFDRSSGNAFLTSTPSKSLPSEFARDCHVGICSPPYANRLDYSAMWAPEISVLSEISDACGIEELKERQVAANVTRNRTPSYDAIGILPEQVVTALKGISSSSEYASNSYYYPYFANFALDLHWSMTAAIAAGSHCGTWILFLRDTARKDVLLESHLIIDGVFEGAGYKRDEASNLSVLRSHVGVARRNYARAGLHGLAQREWTLIYSKG